jgi:outer membrane lipoprotein SlyB
MSALRSLRPALAALALLALIPACAPRETGSTVPSAALGGQAYVSYGTIVGSRPVQVRGSGGIGTVGGAVAGGIAGSFIGGDTRSNLLGALGGAVLGGLAGGAAERGVTGGQAIEFIVREDGRGDVAIVQTNEDELQVGDRVVITRGDRVRLARAAGPAPGAPQPVVTPQAAPATGRGALK